VARKNNIVRVLLSPLTTGTRLDLPNSLVQSVSRDLAVKKYKNMINSMTTVYFRVSRAHNVSMTVFDDWPVNTSLTCLQTVF